MRKFLIVSLIMMSFADLSVLADDSYKSTRSNSRIESMNKELKTRTITRNVLFVGSVVGMLAGTAQFISGSGEIDDAENTPGCGSDGATLIICGSESSFNAAQQKKDDGEAKQLQGGLIFLAGLGLGAIGLYQHAKSQTLRRKIRKAKALSWDLRYRGADSFQLVSSYRF